VLALAINGIPKRERRSIDAVEALFALATPGTPGVTDEFVNSAF
jgi:hypothetical protein